MVDIYSIEPVNFHAMEPLLTLPLLAAIAFVFAYVLSQHLDLSITQAWRNHPPFRTFFYFIFFLTFAFSATHVHTLVTHAIGYQRQKNGQTEDLVGVYTFLKYYTKRVFYEVGPQNFEGSAAELPCYPGTIPELDEHSLNGKTVRISYTLIGDYKCVTKLQLIEK